MGITPAGRDAIASSTSPRYGDAMDASRTAHAEIAGADQAVVDLVIAVGTNAPMLEAAMALDGVLDASVDAAAESCPSSMRITCLGVGGSFGTTRFKTSASDYLATYVTDRSDPVETPLPPGGLACAVIDLSKYFDWLPGAYKAIFLAGDIGLQIPDDEFAKTTAAIAAAKAADVKVYACACVFSDAGTGTNGGHADPGLALTGKDIAEYMRLGKQTDGAGYVCTNGQRDFPWMLRDVICDNVSGPRHENGGREANGPDVGGGASSCCCDCEQTWLIVQAASTLSTVLRKVADNCYPEKGETY